MSTAVQIVMPTHNEESTIKNVLYEFYSTLQDNHIAAQFIVCEDGSTDGTLASLKKIGAELPMHLIAAPRRKGYARAVTDGLRAATAPTVGFVDSDGQYDPNDFIRLYHHRNDADLIIGYRNPRRDPLHRRNMSSAFRLLYRHATGVKLKDPSCPYGVASQRALRTVLQDSIGIFQEGFWWEFYARALAHGLSMKELPVRHLPRHVGATTTFHPTRIPHIAYHHLRNLTVLRNELNRIKQEADKTAASDVR